MTLKNNKYTIATIIQTYLYLQKSATANQIATFINTHQYPLNKGVTTMDIIGVIQYYTKQKHTKMLKEIKTIQGNPNKYTIEETQ